MKAREYSDPREYLEAARAFLEQDEVVNNLPLSIVAARAAAEPKPATPSDDASKDPFFGLVEDSGAPVFAMLMTPPHNLIVYAPAGTNPAAYEVAVAHIRDHGIAIPGIIGPRGVAIDVANAWCALTGASQRVRMEQMIYRLDRVADVPLSPGSMIVAKPVHVDILSKWFHEFSRSTPDPTTADLAHRRAERFIKEQNAFLWIDSRPVSMTASARATRNCGVVNAVFTPKRYRNHGYATSCVAALSRRLLEQGFSSCSLYTDLSNPVSNRIYKKIGYRPVERSIMIEFYDRSDNKRSAPPT